MIIRSDQIRTFEAEALGRFVDEMKQHLQNLTPAHCVEIGESCVERAIRHSIRRANEHGFTNRGPVRLYIELALMFGSDFDTEPMLPWIAPILNDRGIPDQMERAQHLHAKVLEFLGATTGPDFQLIRTAFQHLRSIRYEDLVIPWDNFEAECMTRLRAAYPHKCAHVGEPALRTLIREAIAKATARSILQPPGILLFVFLSFYFGHGFSSDPLHPWISETLDNPASNNNQEIITTLLSKTSNFIEHVTTARA